MNRFSPNLPSTASHILVGSPLRKPLPGLLILAVLAMLILIGALSITGYFGVQSAGALQVFALALLLSVLMGLPALAFLRYLDRREREAPCADGSGDRAGAAITGHTEAGRR